jgi:cholesterol transport system auxiliary component
MTREKKAIKHMHKKSPLLLLSCFLTGCTLFPEGQEPLPLYTLKSETYKTSNALTKPLAIDYPVSEASLDTERIAITPSLYQRDYLADGQWPDRLPKVVHNVFVESLSERWGAVYVNRSGIGLQTHYVLTTEIQEFAVQNLEVGYPEVHLKILFKLIDFRNHQALAAKIFTEKVPVRLLSADGIVIAFNHGLHCLLLKAMPWMEEVFSKENYPRHPHHHKHNLNLASPREAN